MNKLTTEQFEQNISSFFAKKEKDMSEKGKKLLYFYFKLRNDHKSVSLYVIRKMKQMDKVQLELAEKKCLRFRNYIKKQKMKRRK